MSGTGMSKTAFMAVGAVFAAMFFVSSNIIPPIYVLPGVPVTFQILFVVLMAAVLGTKGSLITLGVVYGLTLVGLPMMSGFAGGIGAFARPSGGFMFILSVPIYYIKEITVKSLSESPCVPKNFITASRVFLSNSSQSRCEILPPR